MTNWFYLILLLFINKLCFMKTYEDPLMRVHHSQPFRWWGLKPLDVHRRAGDAKWHRVMPTAKTEWPHCNQTSTSSEDGQKRPRNSSMGRKGLGTALCLVHTTSTTTSTITRPTMINTTSTTMSVSHKEQHHGAGYNGLNIMTRACLATTTLPMPQISKHKLIYGCRVWSQWPWSMPVTCSRYSVMLQP